MAKLFQTIGSLAGDYSGAASVLHDMDGMLIFCDAGACMGGFLFGEDPKGGNEKRRIFTASLREKQVVMGIDKKVKADAIRTYQDAGGEFIGLIGTPVSAVIGADLEGIGREICQSLQREGYTQEVIPNIAVSTNGLNCYDSGQEKAYQALATTFVNEEQEATGDVHVLGATPIDMWDYTQIHDCIELLKEAGAKNPIVWGANGGIQEIAGAAGSKLNIAVSVSGLKTVKYLKKKYGTPYLVGYPLGKVETEKWKEQVHQILIGEEPQECRQIRESKSGKRALVIAEQYTGCALRKLLKEEFQFETVDVASFFKMDEEMVEEHDLQIKDEETFQTFLKTQMPYDLVVADPFCEAMLPYKPKKIIALPHIAVSAVFYANQSPNIFGEKASVYFQEMLKEGK